MRRFLISTLSLLLFFFTSGLVFADINLDGNTISPYDTSTLQYYGQVVSKAFVFKGKFPTITTGDKLIVRHIDNSGKYSSYGNNYGKIGMYLDNTFYPDILSSSLQYVKKTPGNIDVYQGTFNNQVKGVVKNPNNDGSYVSYNPLIHDVPPPVTPTNPVVTDPQPYDGISAGTDTPEFSKLPNPLGGAGINTTGDAIDKITTILMIIAVPFVTIMIMYAGFCYIAAYGNPEKIRAANKRALWTLVGTLLLFGAATIGNAIIKTIQKITTDGATTTNSTTNQSQPNPPNVIPTTTQTLPGQGTNTQTPPVVTPPTGATTNLDVILNVSQVSYNNSLATVTTIYDVKSKPSTQQTLRQTFRLLKTKNTSPFDPTDTRDIDEISRPIDPSTSGVIKVDFTASGSDIKSKASSLGITGTPTDYWIGVVTDIPENASFKPIEEVITLDASQL